MITFTEIENSVTFAIRVIPRASRSEVVGEFEGSLKVRLSAPPVDGAANTEAIKLLAKEFGVARSSVSIVSGETSKSKRIRVEGGTAKRLQELAGG